MRMQLLFPPLVLITSHDTHRIGLVAVLSPTSKTSAAEVWRRRPCGGVLLAPESSTRCLQAAAAHGEVKRCLNLGSYNYLGFAAADAYCTPRVLNSLRDLGWSSCGSRGVAGAR